MRYIKKKWFSIVIIISVFVLNASPSYAHQTDTGFDFTADHTSKTLHQYHMELVKRYSDILQIEVLGYSVDQQPIYVVRLGEHDNNKGLKMNGLVESGNHAREIANPLLVTRMVEDYCLDYYNDAHLPQINVKGILKDAVLHFVVLVNPDGFNLTQYGVNGLYTANGKSAISKVSDTQYDRFKSNIRGVDLNRNFPGLYFDVSSKTWKDIWNVKTSYYASYKPSKEFYHGPYAGSEPETRAMMAYVQKYDFRFALSYHSQGEVIYWEEWMLSKEANAFFETYATLASRATGYPVKPYVSSQTSSGYFSDYFSMTTLKPNVIVETLRSTSKQLMTEAKLLKAYTQVYELPYLFMKKALNDGYGDYHLYVNDEYVRDFREKVYADAHSAKMGGKIVVSTDAPALYAPDVVTREAFVTQMMQSRFSKDLKATEETTAFDDCVHPSVVYAKSLGIIGGSDSHFHPNRPITPSEAAVVMYNIDRVQQLEVDYDQSIEVSEKVPQWAVGYVQFAIAKGYLSQENTRSKFLKIDDLLRMMH